MANASIKSAFERLWEHTLAKLNTKSDINHNHAKLQISVTNGDGSAYTGYYDGTDDWDIDLNIISRSTVISLIREISHPIGSIYMSASPENPSLTLGGTWIAWGSGRVPVGVNTSDGNFNTVEKTGGSSTVTLTSAQMPSHTHTGPSHTHTGPSHTHSVGAHSHGLNGHTHSIPALSGSTNSTGAHQHYLTFDQDIASGSAKHRVVPNGNGGTTAGKPGTTSAGNHTHTVTTNASTTGGNSGSTANSGAFNTGAAGTGNTGSAGTGATGSAGSGGAHSNLQPYITCYMWKRTA